MAETAEVKIEAITETDAEAANSIPAIYCNRFYVTVSNVVRIAFAERSLPDKQPVFRTAIALGHYDAIELAKLLRGLLSEIEAQIEAAKSQAGTPNA